MDVRRTVLAWAGAFYALGLPVLAQNPQDGAPCRSSGNCYPVGHPMRAYGNADEEQIQRLAKIIFESDLEDRRIEAVNRLAQIPRYHPDVPKILDRASKVDPSIRVRRAAALGMPRYKIAASISAMPYQESPSQRGFAGAKNLFGGSKSSSSRVAARPPASPGSTANAPKGIPAASSAPVSRPANVVTSPALPSAPRPPVRAASVQVRESEPPTQEPTRQTPVVVGTLRSPPASAAVPRVPVQQAPAPVAETKTSQPIPVAVRKPIDTPNLASATAEPVHFPLESARSLSNPVPQSGPAVGQKKAAPRDAEPSIVEPAWRPTWTERATPDGEVVHAKADGSAANSEIETQQVQFLRQGQFGKQRNAETRVQNAREPSLGTTNIPDQGTATAHSRGSESRSMPPSSPRAPRAPSMPDTTKQSDPTPMDTMEGEIVATVNAEAEPPAFLTPEHEVEPAQAMTVANTESDAMSSTASLETARKAPLAADGDSSTSTNQVRSVFSGLLPSFSGNDTGRRTVRVMTRQPDTTDGSIAAAAYPANVRKTSRVMAKLPSRTVLLEGSAEEGGAALDPPNTTTPIAILNSTPELTPAPLSVTPPPPAADSTETRPFSTSIPTKVEKPASRPVVEVALSTPVPIATSDSSGVDDAPPRDLPRPREVTASVPVPPAAPVKPVTPPSPPLASAPPPSAPVTTVVRKPFEPLPPASSMVTQPAKPASAKISGAEAIQAAQSKRLLPADKLPANVEERKEMAKQMMQECKQLIKEGKFDQAEMHVYRVRELAVDYGLFEETPRDLMIQIGNARLRHMRKSH